MCLMGGGGGNAAEESRQQAAADAARREQQAAAEAEQARQREADRQARLEQGRQSIDSSFGGFNDDFYGGVSKRYNEFYAPQLTDQYAKAYRTLVANLSRTGNMNSSAGLRQKGELADRLTQEQALTNERALAAANDVRSKVEGARSELNGQLLVSADPSNVASVGTAASNRANLLASPDPLGPLSDVFGSLVQQAGNYLSPYATSKRESGGVQLFGNKKGGSSTVVT